MARVFVGNTNIIFQQRLRKKIVMRYGLRGIGIESVFM
jgi:hypothetical protein